MFLVEMPSKPMHPKLREAFIEAHERKGGLRRTTFWNAFKGLKQSGKPAKYATRALGVLIIADFCNKMGIKGEQRRLLKENATKETKLSLIKPKTQQEAAKIENKIKAGEYRELTKPKEVGGENNVAPPAYENNVAPPAYENNVAPPAYENNVSPPAYENNVSPPPSAPLMAISDYNENNINPPPSAPLMNNDIKQLTETVTAPEYTSRFDDPDNQFPIQNGGKKGKGKGKTKKYNIRFV